MNKTGFLKLFKKEVPNFDETLCHFEFKRYDDVRVKFVLDGKLVCLCMYKCKSEIDLWKQHFIEYFETKSFDYNGYWRFYTCGETREQIFVNNNVYKVPLCKSYGDDFHEHSPEFREMFVIRESINMGLGIKHVPKPTDLENLNLIEIKSYEKT